MFKNLTDYPIKLKHAIVAGGIAVLLVLAGFWLGLKNAGYLSTNQTVDDTLKASATSQTTPVVATPTIAGTSDNSITSVVKKVGPAVVAIETKSTRNIESSNNRRFNRNFSATPYSQQEQTEQGLGSGFIISKDGYILTNNHVIEGADSINVRLQGETTTKEAKIVGTDEALDVALLKIDAGKDLPVVAMGDSDAIQAGDGAVAIGNPFGLDHTVTAGVISAKGRPLTIGTQNFKNLLQTDASINPGNSGGPLLNLKGEVIGINTAINAEGQGLGFAIPINTVQEVLTDLIKKGKVSRPWVGVSIEDMTPELAAYAGVDNEEGAVIAQVVSGSPAEKAGLKQGDIIVEVDKQKITDSQSFSEKISSFKAGAKIQLQVSRQGVLKTIDVLLAEK
ncbi:Do/DeqQ family serine protease [Aneurinibacillus soli]|uniref:Putative serine protease HhoB n=1 Tax=Aneurinibacillus soli TaxID=1500254 RepID=A0A0U4WF84_9BACL|nr:trypsin-like peptidase domain-containing protein [Aneurinibacillus soli]PYE63664.1 Do/DeqQ family serine protease [Aneurinibacillus soli]BAU27403.1 putative serine protease HhoB precursor [Aneurinibacillus soli]